MDSKRIKKRERIGRTRGMIREIMSKYDTYQNAGAEYVQDRVDELNRLLILADKEERKKDYEGVGKILETVGNLVKKEYDKKEMSAKEARKFYDAIMHRYSKMNRRNLAAAENKINNLLSEIAENKKRDLERRSMVILAGVSFLVSFFLFSLNLTGNIIKAQNLAQDGTILGAVFFLVGLVGILLYSRKR